MLKTQEKDMREGRGFVGHGEMIRGVELTHMKCVVLIQHERIVIVPTL